MITHLHSIAVVVSDPDQALKFYREALGFEVTADVRDPMNSDNRWLTLRPKSAQTNLMLLKASAQKPDAASLLGKPTHIVVVTDDIEAECERIESHGARIISGAKRAGWGQAFEAQFADPDGNIFLLIEPTSPAGGLRP